MPCMKRPFNTERQALANQRRINKRRGAGRTEQQAYPCPDCSTDGPTTWHLRTETQLPASKRGPRRHRPAAQAWQDEDYEGNWAA